MELEDHRLISALSVTPDLTLSESADSFVMSASKFYLHIFKISELDDLRVQHFEISLLKIMFNLCFELQSDEEESMDDFSMV